MLAAVPILVIGFAGCGEESAPPAAVVPEQTSTTGAVPENHAPVVERVTLEPRDPKGGQEIRATVSASDEDGDRLRMFFSWSVNGEVREVGRKPVYRPLKLRSGDRVTVEVVASDGRLESEPQRASASAGNRPPSMLSVRLSPFSASSI